MKYCENCGAKLDDNATFCDECGAKQVSQTVEEKPSISSAKKKGKILGIIGVAIVLVALVIGVYYYEIIEKQKENPDDKEKLQQELVEQSDSQTTSTADATQEPLDLKDKLKWSEDSKKIEDLKSMQYMNKSIGETMNTNTSIIKWQCANDQGVDYLLCTYLYEDEESTLIFCKDTQNNVKIAEGFQEGKKQEEAQTKEMVEELFKDREFSSERIGFFSNGKWAMEIVNVDITAKTISYYSYWWNFQTQTMEQSETDLKSIGILDVDTMGDDTYAIKWNGNDSFTMQKYDCEILLNNDTIGSRDGRSDEFWESGMGEFQRVEKPQNIPISEFENEITEEENSEEYQDIRLPQVPPEGRYWGDIPLYSAYYIDISNAQDDRFDFEIYQAQSFNEYGEASDYKLVFQHHTAVFEDSYHAVYEGQNYTLHFECGTNTGYITISGFNEVIPDGSTLSNTEWLGVS